MAFRSWSLGRPLFTNRPGTAAAAAALCATLASQAGAATFSGFSGTLSANAFSGGATDNQSSPISSSPPDNYGTYSVPVSVTTPPGSGFFGNASATSQANLGPDSFLASTSWNLSESAPGLSRSSGSVLLDFSVLNPVSVDLQLNASGNFTGSLQAVGAATALYSVTFPQSGLNTFSQTALLDLQPGTYQLSLAGSYQTIAGTFTNAQGIGVQVAPTPIPAAVWLFGSGLVALGGLFGRKRATA